MAFEHLPLAIFDFMAFMAFIPFVALGLFMTALACI
eukprot:CAMPEP_0175663914 /NCGR_PEP_ID=MMETSP0097-20121207/16258_1 /TAXON_ID=311494 /ORGANISM="Alexandrium monilatum, Strain CCMP3105" /LENGTH=35 /DNA_ID= /DNA_START= /DNA_END= /DNA_ORIENTATION=